MCIDKSDKTRLDIIEGLGHGYEEKSIKVTLENNKVIKTTAYIATNDHIDDNLRPFDWYYYYVLEGARENGLNEEYIRKIEEIEFEIDSNETRRKEHRDILEMFKTQL